MSPEVLIAAVLLLPLAGAVLILLLGSWPNIRDTVTLLVSLGLFFTVTQLLPNVLAGEMPGLAVGEITAGLTVALSVEPLGLLFALVASSLWFVTTIYAVGYMRANNYGHQTTFYLCFAIAIAATMGVAFSANLFTLFLCYEVLTLSTYPLVIHKRTPEAIAAGRVYLLLLLGTSLVLFLPAVVSVWVLTGTLDFTTGGILSGHAGPGILGVLLLLFVYGIGKAAVMPLHWWLPAAMVAPTPVSALLHAVAVVKAGVFAILKVMVYIFGADALYEAGANGWLVWVAGATVIAASLVALKQDDLKRRLAYSTVSQLSYVILAAAVLSPLSMAGAAMHIAAHGVSKIVLFFSAGAIATATGLKKVSELAGIGHRMPVTMTCFAIASISLIGLPPTVGFVSKWFMLEGAMSVDAWVVLGVLVASTLLTAGYFLPIVVSAFLRAPQKEFAAVSLEAPFPILLALALTAAGTLGLFFFAEPALTLAKLFAGNFQ
jgi:multicomponent Na+:H+ antiporter subunit D